MEQTLTTIPGKNYRVRFSMGNVVNPSGVLGTESTVKVLFSSFTASETSTVIAFMNGDPFSDTANGLDNVVTTQEP